MSALINFLLAVLLSGQVATTQSIRTLEFGSAWPERFLNTPIPQIAGDKTVNLLNMTEIDREAVIAKLSKMQNLESVTFLSCDLSSLNEKDPIPPRLTFVAIAGGRITQKSIGWLAKLPEGSEIFLSGNLRGLNIDVGPGKDLVFSNCVMSRTVVLKIIEQLGEATFDQITVVDE